MTTAEFALDVQPDFLQERVSQATDKFDAVMRSDEVLVAVARATAARFHSTDLVDEGNFYCLPYIRRTQRSQSIGTRIAYGIDRDRVEPLLLAKGGATHRELHVSTDLESRVIRATGWYNRPQIENGVIGLVVAWNDGWHSVRTHLRQPFEGFDEGLSETEVEKLFTL